MILQRKLLYFLVFISIRAEAQKTAVYSDPEADFKTAYELFQQQAYGPAQLRFADAEIKMKRNGINEKNIDFERALFYHAVCSEMLQQTTTEKEFTDITTDYENNPFTRLAYFHLGNLYFDEHRYADLIEAYHNVDPIDLSESETADYEFRFGYAYFFRRQFDDAKKYFYEVKVNSNKYYYPANYYYGYISYSQKDFQNALQSFHVLDSSQLYKKIVPFYITQIYYLQGKYQKVIDYGGSIWNRDSSVKYSDQLAQLIGKSYFNLKDYESALPYLSFYYTKNKNYSASDAYMIGFCQLQENRYADAVKNFQQVATQHDSIGQNALYLAGVCYLNLNEKTQARAAFAQAKEMDADKIVKQQALFQYAKLSYDLGFNSQAIESFQLYVKNYPNAANEDEAREALTSLFLKSQDYTDALNVIRSLHSLTPNEKAAYQRVAYEQGLESYNTDDYANAIQLFDESLKNPTDKNVEADCYFWKGETEYANGNYASAISDYNQFLDLHSENGSEANAADANYGIGYCYFQQKKYDEAAGYFSQALPDLSTKGAVALRGDALLRSGDCSFELHNYSHAEASYDNVIANNYPGADYALYQKAIIEGLQGNDAAKEDDLNRIMSEFKSSTYADDALYEKGTTLLNDAQYQPAINVFNQLINSFPHSVYVRSANNKIALSYYNLNDTATALRYYKNVATQYPNTQEGRDALAGMKEIYVSGGNANGYLNALKNIPGANISNSSQDSLLYQSAENTYLTGNCDLSTPQFTNYLVKFPNGLFAVNAHNYRGECLLKIKSYDDALPDFEFVADAPVNKFTERAAQVAGQLNYTDKKNYTKAYKYFAQLLQTASNKQNILTAEQGMMYSAFYLNNFSDARNAAQQILQNDQSTADNKTETYFYLGKIDLADSNYTTAFGEFQKVETTKSIIGAESSYQMAYIFYKQKDLKQAESQCNEVAKNFSDYNYWLAKSYLLLGFVYFDEGDLFQSKSTLQSIVDNYKGDDDVLPAAKLKLQQVEVQQAKQSRLIPDSTQNNLVPDTTTLKQ
jgi:tetratricopeptide (TPR) repeat protein